MDQEEFCKGIFEVIRRRGVKSTLSALEKAPGRQPDKRDVELSRWYHSLGEEDKSALEKIIKEAVDTTLFGVLCLIDGCTFIEPEGEKTEFLLYAKKDGKTTLINDPHLEELHNLYIYDVQQEHAKEEER